MGSTWLTVFSSKDGTKVGNNPQNAEFAIQVSAPEEVDALYEALIAAGGKEGWEPSDTSMYEEMRFAYVDDPFGMRIDIYCLLPRES
jgi:predicted 3-demethylubiquinone-9 3-methyltransferase (glyoxalase superfamily)